MTSPNQPHPHFLWADLFKRRKADQPLLDVLRNNVLFSTLSRKELGYLSTHVYERVYQRGEAIFHQNDRGLGMYVISKGRVAIKTESAASEVLVTTLEEGSFFGELALVDPDNVRSASAVALEKTVLVGFFKPDLMEILERRPALAVKILFQLAAVLGRRLIETTDRISSLTREKQTQHE